MRGLGVLVIRPAVRSLHQDRAGRGHMSLNPISSQSLTVFIYFCSAVLLARASLQLVLSFHLLPRHVAVWCVCLGFYVCDLDFGFSTALCLFIYFPVSPPLAGLTRLYVLYCRRVPAPSCAPGIKPSCLSILST